MGREIVDIDDFGQYLRDEGKAELTCKNYLQDICQFSLWFFQTNGYELSPEGLTSTDVREYRQYLQITERAAPSTINRHLAAIRSYVSWAQHTGSIDHNPLQSIRGVREQETAPRWLDRRELARLERELERRRSGARTTTARMLSLRNQVIFTVLVNTGE